MGLLFKTVITAAHTLTPPFPQNGAGIITVLASCHWLWIPWAWRCSWLSSGRSQTTDCDVISIIILNSLRSLSSIIVIVSITIHTANLTIVVNIITTTTEDLTVHSLTFFAHGTNYLYTIAFINLITPITSLERTSTWTRTKFTTTSLPPSVCSRRERGRWHRLLAWMVGGPGYAALWTSVSWGEKGPPRVDILTCH